jgi:hypothetical protein
MFLSYSITMRIRIVNAILMSFIAVPTLSSPDVCSAQQTSEDLVLATGEFSIPAASTFNDPGFHLSIQVNHDVDSLLQSTRGATIALSLLDASRPTQTCSVEHPTSGCATVDWSDFEDRPRVPEGGVFDNSIRLQMANGEGLLFLRETGALLETPEQWSPT